MLKNFTPVVVTRWCNITNWISIRLKIECKPRKRWVLRLVELSTSNLEQFTENDDPSYEEVSKDTYFVDALEYKLYELTESRVAS